MLSSPMQPGGSYVVVASRGGDDRHPAWYLNLVANPEVEVDYRGGGKQKRIARVATAAERAELWPKVTADYGFYAAYQKRTDREIPLVFLDPVAQQSAELAARERRQNVDSRAQSSRIVAAHHAVDEERSGCQHPAHGVAIALHQQ